MNDEVQTQSVDEQIGTQATPPSEPITVTGALAEDAVGVDESGNEVHLSAGEQVTAELPAADDTAPEEELLDALQKYLGTAKVRFAASLDGMANTTAELVRCVGDSIIHLGDHIDQAKSTRVTLDEEVTNG